MVRLLESDAFAKCIALIGVWFLDFITLLGLQASAEPTEHLIHIRDGT